MSFSLDDLYVIMRDVFALRTFQFGPAMMAQDVPGWTSLNHTVLLMEIEVKTGVSLTAAETALLPTIGALHNRIAQSMPIE